MKKSISYWSFSGKNVFEAMRLAKDAGFDGIELTLDAEGDVTMETAPEKLAEIRRAAEEACGEDRPRDIAVTLYPDSGTQRVVEIVFDWPENVENNA